MQSDGKPFSLDYAIMYYRQLPQSEGNNIINKKKCNAQVIILNLNSHFHMAAGRLSVKHIEQGTYWK